MARIYTLTISLAVLFFGIIPSILAEEIKEFAEIENDTLVIYGAKEKYPAPPKGISPEIARQLIRGEITNPIASEAKTIKLISAVLPRIETTITQTKTSWSGEHWISIKLPPKKSEKTNPFSNISWLLIPALCIFMVSLERRKGNRQLIIFYMVIIGSILIAVLLACLDLAWPIPIGVIIGMVAGIFTGEICGMIAGGLVTIFASLFAGNSTSETIIICQEYVPFIILICFFSFVITKLISERKIAKEIVK